jgi:UDP-3-O-[3-hydroxymyristoyl] glucosamine N-acyltransferase
VGTLCEIGAHVVIGRGTQIGDGCDIYNSVRIEQDVVIGDRCHVINAAQIDNYSTIGSDCVIGGVVSENSRIGDNCRIFGKLVHSYLNPSLPWDRNVDEPAPELAESVVVAHDAILVGGVKIGRQCYVLPGAIVTTNMPARHIAKGINNFVSHNEWPGPLGSSEFFK